MLLLLFKKCWILCKHAIFSVVKWKYRWVPSITTNCEFFNNDSQSLKNVEFVCYSSNKLQHQSQFVEQQILSDTDFTRTITFAENFHFINSFNLPTFSLVKAWVVSVEISSIIKKRWKKKALKCFCFRVVCWKWQTVTAVNGAKNNGHVVTFAVKPTRAYTTHAFLTGSKWI